MKYSTLIASLLASTLISACGFQSKSEVLMPTAPSGANSSSSTGGGASSSTSSTSSSSSSTSASSSSSVFSGIWASSTPNGLPNIGSCSELQWQITNLTATDIAGNVTATCGGSVTITADLTGKLNGSDVIDLTAKGQAVGLGITCGFTLTGVGTRQSTDSVELDYQGTTCLGPVKGTEMLRRNSPAPAPAPPAPEAPAPPAPPAGDDDVLFGCTRMLPDKGQYVKCIHARIRPTDEFSAFEVTKRVAWGLRGEGAGLLLKPTGANIVTWRGYTFSASRIIYPDGHLFKVVTDVGPGGANGPGWLDDGFVDVNRRVPAIDPRLP